MARKMKDSGIEWIGDIPEGWEVTKLKYLSTFPIEKNAHTDSPYIGLENIESWTGKYVSSDSQYDKSQALAFFENNILFGKLRPYLAKVFCASNDGCCSSEFCILNFSSSVNIRYFWNLLISPTFIDHVTKSTYGTKMPRANTDFIKNICVPVPPRIEQDRIALYLDATSAKIDSLISETRSSIEEYKKLKQAVITQAVTKGIRGEREMKDSGVEWIGKIPREFDPVQLKFFCKLITDGTHFSPTTVENGWPYITAGDVHGIGLDYNSAKRISEENFQLLVAQGCQPLKGDVLLVKDGATTGRVGFVDSDTPCVILSSVAMLRPADNTDGHYLMYLLASDFLQKQILVSMAGSAMPRTTLTKLTKYIGLLPPLHEQKEIADYLDAKCAEIDKLIAKKEQLVKELESYKKSLIYEVVTGKREV